MKLFSTVSILILLSFTLATPTKTREQLPQDTGSSCVAGAKIDQGNYTRAQGTFKIPNLKAPSTHPGWPSCMYISVVFDGGDGGHTPFDFYMGIKACVQNKKTLLYLQYPEWHKQPRIEFDMNVGDEIQIIIDKSGTSTIKNLTTGKSAVNRHEMVIFGDMVSWLIEFYSDPLTDFSTFQFTDMSAIRNGKQVDIQGAVIYDIKLLELYGAVTFTKTTSTNNSVTIERLPTAGYD